MNAQENRFPFGTDVGIEALPTEYRKQVEALMSLPNSQTSVSVIIEGDNEPHCPGAMDGNNETEPLCLGLLGLLEQDFPLNEVDLIMVGNPEQIERWQRQTKGMLFGRVRLISRGDADYCQMKQAGAAMGTSPILAFVDSDVRPSPRWLSRLKATIESGSGVSVGLTQLHWHGWAGPQGPIMLAFASVAWGGILGTWESGGSRALGFHANNVGFRRDLLKVAGYRPGLLRACAAHDLFRSWIRAGTRASFHPEQRVVHAFEPAWWAEMHARSGMESMLMRRLFDDWPHRWVRHLGPLEPLLTTAWRCVRDPIQGWRYSTAVGLSRTRRIVWLPVLLVVSLLTRSVEMFGGYRGLIRGDLKRELATHQWAGQ